jgi:hypothetical protein
LTAKRREGETKEPQGEEGGRERDMDKEREKWTGVDETVHVYMCI